MRTSWWIGVLWVCAAWLSGCGMTVHAPTDVQDPVSVFIADHGIHSSLLLPREDGTIAQFAYSQWNWAALDQDQWYRSPLAMFVPASGTLGWRDFDGPCDFNGVCDKLNTVGRYPPMEAVYELEVERAAAEKLLADLDERWKSQSDGKVFNEKRGMTFVKDASTYSLAHTCNNEVAGWLKSMGCRVTGMSKTADIKVVGGRRVGNGLASGEKLAERTGKGGSEF